MAETSTATAQIGRRWAMTSMANFAIGGVALIVAPIVARILETEGRGRLAAIQLTPQLLADLSALGLGFSVVHFGARKTSSIGTLLRWSIKPILLGSAALMALGYVLAGPIAGGPQGDEKLLRLYLLACPIVAFTAVMLESLRANGDFGRWNGLVFARGMSWPTALLIGVILPAEPSLRRVVITHLVLLTIVFSAALIVTRSRTQSLRDEPSSDRRSVFRFGFTSALSALPRSANAKVDQIILAAIVIREELGLYAAAVGWSALTIPVLRGLTGVSMPHVSGATDENRPRRVGELVSLAVGAGFVLAVVGIIVTVVAWNPLYGDKFADALPAAIVLIPAALLLELNAIFGNVLRSIDRPGLVFGVEAAVLLVASALLFPVVQMDAVLGPAILSLATYLTVGIAMIVLVARQLGVPATSLLKREYITEQIALIRTRIASR